MSVACIVRQILPQKHSPRADVEDGHEADRGKGGTIFLNLYDRRHVNVWRNTIKRGEPWNEYREQRYQRYISKGIHPDTDFEGWGWTTSPERRRLLDARNVCYERDEEPGPELDLALAEADADWDDDAVFEAYLAYHAKKMYKSETSVLNTLSPDDPELPVPHLLGTVVYQSPIGPIKGVLLEYVENSVSLKHYLQAAGSCGHMDAKVARVCDNAKRVFRTLALQKGVMQKDPTTECILIQMNGPFADHAFRDEPMNAWSATAQQVEAILAVDPLKFFVIDFCHARTKYADETENEWAEQKNWMQESRRFEHRMATNILLASKEGCKLHGRACKTARQRKKRVWRQKDPDRVFWHPEWSPEELPIVEHNDRLGFYENRLRKCSPVYHHSRD